MSALHVQVKVEEAASQQEAEIVIISDSDEDERLAPPPSKRVKHAETEHAHHVSILDCDNVVETQPVKSEQAVLPQDEAHSMASDAWMADASTGHTTPGDDSTFALLREMAMGSMPKVTTRHPGQALIVEQPRTTQQCVSHATGPAMPSREASMQLTPEQTYPTQQCASHDTGPTPPPREACIQLAVIESASAQPLSTGRLMQTVLEGYLGARKETLARRHLAAMP